MAVIRRVTLDDAAINRMLHGRGGAVNRMMGGFAGLATRAVRETADERINHQTGAYRRSIKATLTQPDKLEVVADTDYAIILERGARAHPIVPRTDGGLLVFDVGVRTVFARRVDHPGVTGRHILRDGVRRAGRQLNRLAAR